ncbi:hypothetical protein H0W91_01750 [Patescibacteria group bacterium]|nr:hypothetical protein [Patescibacteria group bacterium]
MKQVTLVLLILLISTVVKAQNQGVKCERGQCRMEVTSIDGKTAHDSANTFAVIVGNELKAHYPSKILEPKFEFEVRKQGSYEVFHIIWFCRIVSASSSDADYYFDRRGTLREARTKAYAQKLVRQENQHKFGNTLGVGIYKWKVVSSGVVGSFASTDGNRWWYLEEIFMVAPR